MSKQLLSPAATVKKVFGGDQQVAEVLGLVRSTVWRWQQPLGKGGTDGLIPSQYQQPLISAAKALGKKLTSSDLIFGRITK